jgi:putative peptidoglycan lipid II flippase
MLFAQAGNVCTLMASYIPLYLLSGINKGIITSLNYGKNVSEIPNQMITNQFSVVSGIKYNELVAKGEIDKLNEVFLKTSKFLLFILFAISGLFFLYSEDIIKIVFMRGAFNMKSVSDTALFLKYFGILIPFSAFNTIGAKIFMAMQKIKHAFVYQIITNILLVIFIYLFVNFYGAIGYPIALILIYALSVITIQPLLKITLPTLKYKKLLYFIIKVIIINFLIVIFLYKIGSYININSFARFFLGSFVKMLKNEGLDTPEFLICHISCYFFILLND